jgi:hypothetical protein
MDPVEVASAFRNCRLLLKNPRWGVSWIRGGRAGLFRRLVTESVSQIRSVRLPSSLEDLTVLPPQSALGRLGAPQELLYFVVRITKPSAVVETGVFRGLSTAFILAGLEDNGGGRLFSIDLPSGRYTLAESRRTFESNLGEGESPGFAVPTGLRGRWTLRLGDSRVLLPELLQELRQIEMFYHDSEHSYEMMSWEYSTVLPYLTKTGVLTSDDVQWNSAFSDFMASHHFGWHGVARNRLGLARNPS